MSKRIWMHALCIGSLLAGLTGYAAAADLGGRWAFFPGDDAAAADPARGMGTDAGCRKFLSSREFKASSPQNLVISAGRWKTGDKLSGLSGVVRDQMTTGQKTVARIDSKSAMSTKVEATRQGRALIVIARNKINGVQVYHFCKMP